MSIIIIIIIREYLPRSLIGYWYTVDLWICMFDDACHSWTEMLLCHSIEISISLERLYQSSPFFHHYKGKSMTYLEMNIICSRFFLFLKYCSHPMIAILSFYYSPGILSKSYFIVYSILLKTNRLSFRRGFSEKHWPTAELSSLFFFFFFFFHKSCIL